MEWKEQAYYAESVEDNDHDSEKIAVEGAFVMGNGRNVAILVIDVFKYITLTS